MNIAMVGECRPKNDVTFPPAFALEIAVELVTRLPPAVNVDMSSSCPQPGPVKTPIPDAVPLMTTKRACREGETVSLKTTAQKVDRPVVKAWDCPGSVTDKRPKYLHGE